MVDILYIKYAEITTLQKGSKEEQPVLLWIGQTQNTQCFAVFHECGTVARWIAHLTWIVISQKEGPTVQISAWGLCVDFACGHHTWIGFLWVLVFPAPSKYVQCLGPCTDSEYGSGPLALPSACPLLLMNRLNADNKFYCALYEK